MHRKVDVYGLPDVLSDHYEQNVQDMNEEYDDMINHGPYERTVNKAGVLEASSIDMLRYELHVPGRLLVIDTWADTRIDSLLREEITQAIAKNNRLQSWSTKRMSTDESWLVNDLLRSSSEEIDGYVIVSKFQNFPDDYVRQLGWLAKALSDRDERKAKLIYIGDPGTHEAIIHQTPELALRTTSIRL